jgi:hypothetical protein
MAKTKQKAKTFEDRHGILTMPDRFYIENHGHDSPQTLALALSRPEDTDEVRKRRMAAIIDYFHYLAHLPSNKAPKKALSLMERQKKGTVSMTASASMVGDDSKYSKYNTPEALERARADGNLEEVEAIQKSLKAQEEEVRKIIKNKYSTMIHHIVPPDEDE